MNAAVEQPLAELSSSRLCREQNRVLILPDLVTVRSFLPQPRRCAGVGGWVLGVVRSIRVKCTSMEVSILKSSGAWMAESSSRPRSALWVVGLGRNLHHQEVGVTSCFGTREVTRHNGHYRD